LRGRNVIMFRSIKCHWMKAIGKVIAMPAMSAGA
jgi:hypothetical protein